MKIIVEVRGGVAEVNTNEPADVLIIDYDDLEYGGFPDFPDDASGVTYDRTPFPEHVTGDPEYVERLWGNPLADA